MKCGASAGTCLDRHSEVLGQFVNVNMELRCSADLHPGPGARTIKTIGVPLPSTRSELSCIEPSLENEAGLLTVLRCLGSYCSTAGPTLVASVRTRYSATRCAFETFSQATSLQTRMWI